MEIALYSTKDFEKETLYAAARKYELTLRSIPDALGLDTVCLSKGCDVAVIFSGDDASGPVLCALAAQGLRHIAIRAAGYDNVDLPTACALGMSVANVPEYSPHAIAEHAMALILALTRKIVIADKQVHHYDFTVSRLVGFNLNGKTAGIIGTGRIGSIVAQILSGFGCQLLGYDMVENHTLRNQYGLQYCDLTTLCTQSDIITIHTCLSPQTKYLIHEDLIRRMKPGVMLINTARGAVVNTAHVISGLQSGHIGAFGADVYEHEKGLFFYDHSQQIPEDPMLQELLAMSNVLITPHQAFATKEALENIAETTCWNIDCWRKGISSPNELI